MVQQLINLGTGPDTPGGDTRYAGFDKTRQNFAELYLALTTVTVSTKTANHTLVLGDAGTVIDMNIAGANTVTVPLNATVGFPTSTVLEVCQIGAGPTTITPTAGVTLNGGTAGIALRAQYSAASLRKLGTNAWVVSGDTV